MKIPFIRRGPALACSALIVGLVGVLAGVGVSANLDSKLKVSEFAPAKDLQSQVTHYVGEIRASLASAEAYDEAKQGRVKRDANLLVVLLLTLGLHDEESPLQASAPALVPIAEKLMSSATDYNSAHAAFVELEAGIKNGATGGTPLKWEKRYKLGMLMKQVTTLSAKLRRGVRGNKFQKEAEQNAGYAATLGAIAQATLVDTHEVKNPQDLSKWNELSIQWRSAVGQIGAGIRNQDREATLAALKDMNQSCSDCHTAFRIE